MIPAAPTEALATLRLEENEIVLYDSGEALRIDLVKIARALNRLGEVAHVTQAKAPELLTALNLAHLDLGKLITQLTYRLQVAKSKLRREKARVLLDEVPKLLEERKQSSSADLRAALVEASPSVMAAQDSIDQIEAALTLMKCKAQACEWAFTSIKRLLGDGQLRPLSAHNPRLSVPLHDDIPAPPPPPEQPTARFGKARY